MPTPTPDQLELLAGAAGGVAVVALGLAGAALLRLRGMQRAHDLLQAGESRESLVAAVGRQRTELEQLRAEVRAAREELGVTRAELGEAIRHVAVVRYDAFADMGGRLSFSAALLDDAGHGLVLTSINGRSETRTYAKGVRAGASEHQLSPEEHQALAYATGRVPTHGRRRASSPTEGVPAASEPQTIALDDSVEGVTVRS